MLRAMKRFRTFVLLAAVGVAAAGLAALPVIDELPEEAPGIVVGEVSSSDGGGTGHGAEGDADEQSGGGPNGEDLPGADDDGVAIPQPEVSGQPTHTAYTDGGVGSLQGQPSPQPGPDPAPAPAAANNDSSGSSSSGSRSAGGSDPAPAPKPKPKPKPTPKPAPKPAPPKSGGVCDWDDGEWECDDDDDDDDDRDDDDDDDDDD